MQKFFELIPTQTNIDFIGKFKYFMAFSLITGIIVISGIFWKGFNYGIDFSGGTVLQVKFGEKRTSEEIRAALDSIGEKDATVVALGSDSTEYLITARNLHDVKAGSSDLKKSLSDKFGGKMSILREDSVGPKVGKELREAAILSLFFSVLFIGIYIWLRFDIRFAPGATIAMLHDLILAAGWYLFTGREFTITSIAALLTIAGYSVNDTIVIYDRVREIYKRGGSEVLATTINRAVNQTLSRTLLTALVTLLSLVPIAILCEGEIQSFAIVMCFGIFVGVYSTIYIASPFSIYMEKFLTKRKGKGTAKRPAVA